MKSLTEISTTLAVMAAGLTCGSLALLAQDTATTHYVITANDIYRAPSSASVLKLSGLDLLSAPPLATNGWGIGDDTFFGTNLQVVVTIGSNVCIFVSDPGSDDIAAFNAGGFTHPVKIGAFADPSGSGAYLGATLAARGDKLFAAYTASVNIGVWSINSDCSLSLARRASETPTPAPVDGLAVTPDGRTLVATFAQTNPGIGSYAISGNTLVPRGTHNTTAGTAGVDITKDSRYAIVAELGTFTQIGMFPINIDSSLGEGASYAFPQGGFNSNNVALSPDETRLYVNNNFSFQVTTLTFDEGAPAGKQLKFFCLSNPLRTSLTRLAFSN